MSQSAAQIVHESEAQRQYVRVRLPAKVTLNVRASLANYHKVLDIIAERTRMAAE